MLKEFFLTTAFVFVLCLKCFCQLEASIGVVHGTYDMEKMSELLLSFKNSSRLDGKIVSNFPNYFGAEGKLFHKFNRFYVGAHASIHSTGGRFSYADYSGSYHANLLVKQRLVGLGLEYTFNKPIQKLPIQYYASLQLSYGLTNLKIEEAINIIPYINQEVTYKFEADHLFAIQPGFGLRWDYKYLFLKVAFSYFIDRPENFYGANNNISDQARYFIGKFNADWSGLRSSISIGIKINEEKNIPKN